MTEDLEAQKNAENEETKALTDESPAVIKKAAEEMTPESKTVRALNREELMKFEKDPFWIKIRIGLFALFWFIWAAMLVASIVIIIYAPKCPSPEPKTWWQKGPIYKVNSADVDARGNDVPFLQGLVGELDYVVDAGFNSLYLGNIFKIASDGTTVDYKQVQPELGSLADWSSLVEQLEQRNIKVIIDLDPSQTSGSHSWFEKSQAGDEQYTDFYTPGTQNLNLNNHKVIKELTAILDFWVSRGVSGFNIASDQLINAIVVENKQEALSLITALKGHLTSEDGEERAILTAFTNLPISDLAPLYGSDIQDNHIGSMFQLVTGKSLAQTFTSPVTTDAIFNFVNDIQHNLPNNSWPAIAVSSDDAKVGSLLPGMEDSLNMLAAMLQATPVLHAGDELGLSSNSMDWGAVAEQTQNEQENVMTHLGVAKQLAELRHQKTILFGEMENTVRDGCNVITRFKRGNPGYVLIINSDQENQKAIDISDMKGMAATVRVKIESVSSMEASTLESLSFPSTAIFLQPSEARIFNFVPNLKSD